MEYWFYHLTHGSLEAVLPSLLEKTLERGMTASIQFSDAERMEQMNNYLWTFRDDSFLPHGRDDQPGAEQHPVRLGINSDASSADMVFLTGEAEIPDNLAAKRCITFIEDNDPAGRDVARSRWARLKKDGAEISYYQQGEGGQWVKR